MRYRTQLKHVEARQVPPLMVEITKEGFIEQATKIETFLDWLGRGSLIQASGYYLDVISAGHCRPSDWIVRFESGEIVCLSDAIFRDTYEEIPDDSASSLLAK